MAKATNEEEQTPKTTVRRKKQQTVRERSESSTGKKRRVRNAAGKVTPKLRGAQTFGKREYHVVPLPDNRAGAVLGKRVKLVPSFVSDAWNELRQVTWPNRGETIRLTFAVFIFAIVFAIIVGLLGYGLDKLFKEVILK